MLPLLAGHVDISSIEIVKPVVRLTVRESTEPETMEEERDTIALIKNYISSALGYFNEGDRAWMR